MGTAQGQRGSVCKFLQKEDGRERPLGIAALEDKIVQRAIVEVLNANYEQDFLGFSYGFRPVRVSTIHWIGSNFSHCRASQRSWSIAVFGSIQHYPAGRE